MRIARGWMTQGRSSRGDDAGKSRNQTLCGSSQRRSWKTGVPQRRHVPTVQRIEQDLNNVGRLVRSPRGAGNNRCVITRRKVS